MIDEQLFCKNYVALLTEGKASTSYQRDGIWKVTKQRFPSLARIITESYASDVEMSAEMRHQLAGATTMLLALAITLEAPLKTAAPSNNLPTFGFFKALEPASAIPSSTPASAIPTPTPASAIPTPTPRLDRIVEGAVLTVARLKSDG